MSPDEKVGEAEKLLLPLAFIFVKSKYTGYCINIHNFCLCKYRYIYIICFGDSLKNRYMLLEVSSIDVFFYTV